MLPPSESLHTGALPAIDCGLTAIAVAVSFAWPRLGSRSFIRVEAFFRRFARRRRLAVVSVGFGALVLRVAILPVLPVPLPFVPDDFSFLLQADTFAHGRLANPTPMMWTPLESIHVSMQPTYSSMYFPGQGLLLAAGQVLLGHPWYAILAASALMCAAICWMLQAWLPAGWALLGGVLAVLRLGLFSYWVNTYTGGGQILAIGGALVLGSLPRLMKTSRLRYGVLLAIGVMLLVLTRPYEGMLLCIPVAAVLIRWAWVGRNRPNRYALLKLAAFPLTIILAALAWLGYYDFRAFGNPLTLPYTVNRAAYAMAPYFVWQSARPEPVYRHKEMRDFYYRTEMTSYREMHSRTLFVPKTVNKIWLTCEFFASYALLPPLVMVPYLFRDRRIRLLIVCVLVLMAGAMVMVYLIPHYLAPFTAAFYGIGLQCMRHLRFWIPEGRPAGMALVRLTVTACFVLASVRVFSTPLKLTGPEWPAGNWVLSWFGPEHFGTERAQIQDYLAHQPGKQLAIVRYGEKHEPLDQWVYNSADIEGSKVIWAGEINSASDRELLNYYQDRRVWLVEPDSTPARISPYQPAPTTPSLR
jgi:hypothetical protein